MSDYFIALYKLIEDYLHRVLHGKSVVPHARDAG